MKNINEVLKENMEGFWKQVTFVEKDSLREGEEYGIVSDENLKWFAENLISAFKEMVEELPDAEIKITHWGEEMKVKIIAKFTEDILSSLTEEIRHGAGSNCNIDMCPECEKSDNSFSN